MEFSNLQVGEGWCTFNVTNHLAPKMKSYRRNLFSCLALSALLPTASLADSLIVLHVDVQNPPMFPSVRVPAPGDYMISMTLNKAQIVAPNGGITLIDFDRKAVSTLDPKQKTFTQVKLDDFLGLGDKISSSISGHYSAKTTVAFEPTVGQDSRPIAGHPALPYNLDLEGLVSVQRQSRGGGRGGRGLGSILGGGGIFGGGGSSAGGHSDGFPGSSSGSSLSSAGCKIGGELWLANSSVGDCDRTQLSIVESCTLLRFAPGLKTLSDKIKKTNLTLMGASFTVSVFDRDGTPPTKAPVVTVETKSTYPAHFDQAVFSIPSYYIKVDAPTSPLGTSN